MVTKESLLIALEMFINDRITQEELSEWAHDMIIEADGNADPLVTEILFSLMSFHQAGLEFDKFGIGLEQLEHFIS